MVQYLGLQTKETPSYNVRLADEQSKSTQGYCQGLKVTTGFINVFKISLFFNLGCVDLILVEDWLVDLGEFKVNWGTLSMKIHANSGIIEIRSDPSMSKFLISLPTLSKAIDIAAISVLWNLHVEYTQCMHTNAVEL